MKQPPWWKRNPFLGWLRLVNHLRRLQLPSYNPWNQIKQFLARKAFFNICFLPNADGQQNHLKVVLLFLGGPGRNRTTDTRIFKYPTIDRFRFDFKDLSHQPQLVKIVHPSLIDQAPRLLLSIPNIRLMHIKQNNTFITGVITPVINNKSQYNQYIRSLLTD